MHVKENTKMADQLLSDFSDERVLRFLTEINILEVLSQV